jgi:hypothetical protein
MSITQWLKTRWRRRLVPALALLAFLLGTWGFVDLPGCTAEDLTLPVCVQQAAVESLQLFVLNAPPDHLRNWQSFAAQWLAILAVWALAMALFGDRFLQHIRLEWLRIRPATDIVIGGGEEAASMLRTLVGTRAHDGKPRKVIAVTTGDQPLEDAAAAAVIEADSLTAAGLARLATHRTRRIWICTGDELRNALLAAQLRAPLAAKCKASSAPRILASASSSRPGLLDSHLPVAAAGDASSHVSTEFFSLHRLAARTLLRRYLPASRGEPPHIALAGCSTLTRALIVHAAQHCVYRDDPAHCVRVSLFGRGAREFAAQLGQEHPALCAPAGDKSFEGLPPFISLAVHDCDERNIPLALWREAQAGQPFTVAINACELDADTLVTTSRIASLRETTATPLRGNHEVVACRQQVLSQRRALPEELFAAENAPREEPWRWFDVHRDCLSGAERYPGEAQDLRAKLTRLATSQFGQQGGESGPGDAEKLWREDQSDAFRWSDRLAADHLDVKLDVLACWAREHGRENAELLGKWRRYRESPHEEAEGIIRAIESLLAEPAVIDLLSRLEHRRFVTERLVDGWLPLPPQLLGRGVSELDIQEQRLRFRVNHTLVPYDRLPAVDEIVAQRRKDELIVRMIPRILRTEIK